MTDLIYITGCIVCIILGGLELYNSDTKQCIIKSIGIMLFSFIWPLVLLIYLGGLIKKWYNNQKINS